MISKLKVKNVVTIDFQEPYSVGLSGAVDQELKKAGVTVTHLSAPEHDDRLLGLRDQGAEQRRRRLLPHAEAG